MRKHNFAKTIHVVEDGEEALQYIFNNVNAEADMNGKPKMILLAINEMWPSGSSNSLATHKPKVGRGRPTANTRKLVQQSQRLEQKIADLFTHRHLFVQRQLTATEHDTLHRITRGLPQLRALREIWTKSIGSLTVAAEPKPP